MYSLDENYTHTHRCYLLQSYTIKGLQLNIHAISYTSVIQTMAFVDTKSFRNEIDANQQSSTKQHVRNAMSSGEDNKFS